MASDFYESIIDPEVMAKSIKTYLSMFDRYVIKSDLSIDEYKKAKKKIKKLIKHLENGELDEVIDRERFEEFMNGSEDGGEYHRTYNNE